MQADVHILLCHSIKKLEEIRDYWMGLVVVGVQNTPLELSQIEHPRNNGRPMRGRFQSSGCVVFLLKV